MSAPIPLITGTALGQNPGIHTSKGNTASYVQADGNKSMSSALAGPVPRALVGQSKLPTRATPYLSEHAMVMFHNSHISNNIMQS